MGGRNFIQSLFLPLSILLLFISSYIYFSSIDRNVIFLFCNLILFVVIKQSIVEDEEPTKIDAAFDSGNEKKSHVAVFVELVEVENGEEEGKMRVEIDVEERDEFQEKIEAFIEKVKSRMRMEDLQLVTV